MDNRLYHCKIAVVHSSFDEVFSVKLKGTDRQFIPKTKNNVWYMPVANYVNAIAKPNDFVAVDFIAESRLDTNGSVRRVVRIIKLPEAAQKLRNPSYYLIAIKGEGCRLDLRLLTKEYVRFFFTGARFSDYNYPEQFFWVGIAKNFPVVLKNFKNNTIYKVTK